ncbi:MAG: class II aldolase/adducin family protein [Clostridiales Family XIII bacterium]|jgi:rhamnose utilization protein RhaD (predicted bifunctional aldolase and dehydrogenase)|nr:class II aldolase/adducin family protein [Clostridiales Family XIII bacterium]
MNFRGLIAMSRRYGADKDYVLEGGGNTSHKEGGVMAVKASGNALGGIGEEGFVLMDTAKLRAMTKADYPEADDEREACAIKDMMAARVEGQGEKRPSVECILHGLFEQDYVLHVHPALINGLTCAAGGAEAAAELFSDMHEELLWMPLTKPGFILSKACADAFETHERKYGVCPKALLLQNHGVFVAESSTAEIDEIMADIVGRVRSRIEREPDFTKGARKAFPPVGVGSGVGSDAPAPGFAPDEAAAKSIPDSATQIAAALIDSYAEDAGAYAVFVTNAELARLTASKDAAAPLMRPFTPDHIVYDKAYPLWLGRDDHAASVAAAFRAFTDAHAFKPKVALVEGLGAFALGLSEHEAQAAADLLVDAVKISVYSESFGGPSPLPDDFTAFISNWEIESYRQKRSFG